MGFERSKADPCLYYYWTKNGLVLWVSWVDDCLVVGTKEAVAIAKKQLKTFRCRDNYYGHSTVGRSAGRG
jgi:hypothetical protein